MAAVGFIFPKIDARSSPSFQSSGTIPQIILARKYNLRFNYELRELPTIAHTFSTSSTLLLVSLGLSLE